MIKYMIHGTFYFFNEQITKFQYMGRSYWLTHVEGQPPHDWLWFSTGTQHHPILMNHEGQLIRQGRALGYSFNPNASFELKFNRVGMRVSPV